MSDKARKTIKDTTVTLDAFVLRDALVRGCIVVYSGGVPPILENVHLDNCRWQFEGPALHTIEFMRAMAAGPMKDFVLGGILRLPEHQQQSGPVH